MFLIQSNPLSQTPKTDRIQFAIEYFVQDNLDAFFVAADELGRSTFNRVERRMVLLSKDLSGVILPHDHFGTHLSNNKKTINEKLE